MSEEKLIPVTTICLHHQVDVSFVDALHEYELISFTMVGEQHYIEETQLNNLEKFIRFYRELSMNIEGIDAVHRLTQKLEEAQEEITALKNRLSFYEQIF